MLLWLTYNRHSVKAVGSLLELLVPSQPLIRFFPLMAQKSCFAEDTQVYPNMQLRTLLWVPSGKQPKMAEGHRMKLHSGGGSGKIFKGS